ncbi:MAG: hypothetical protein JSV83_00190 [Desulfobacterales bacterium]|nr:MAG: hypothetical protein JSV83_00190 [Desulfobacterales bacterium]
MTQLVIECSDPNDLAALERAVEESVGKCSITYAKQAKKMQEVGVAKSDRAAARKISEETGEPLESVRTRIRRGKKKMGSGEPKKSSGGKRNFSQETLWKRAGKKLDAVCSYMSENCEVQADVDEKLMIKIKNRINFLSTYINDL